MQPLMIPVELSSSCPPEMDVNITVPAAANDVMSNLPLYNAMVARDWEKAKQYVGNVAGATAVITETSDTVLHVAIGLGAPMDFVRNLVALTPKEELVRLKNSDRDTALSVAAAVGNVDAARLLVERNRVLLFVANKEERLPIHMAALCGDRKIVQYLLSVVEENTEERSYCLSGDYGFRLSLLLMDAKFYDLVLKQVESYLKLATMTVDGQSLLGAVTSAIPSSPSSVLNHIESYPTWATMTIDGQSLLGKVAAAIPSPLPTLGIILPGVFARLDYCQARFQKLKKRKLVKCLCEKVTELELSATVELFKPPLLLAVELGNEEVVEGILAAFPPALRFTDPRNYNLLHLAVMHRRWGVFKLISRMYECKHMITATLDDHGEDNILHFAARLPVDILETITIDPFWQMHQENKWFQAVSKLVPPSYASAKNREKKTPKILFRETHRTLVGEGYNWVKDVTNAWSVVAALIATIAFTSAITVPGGAGDNGTPVLYKQPVFVIFAMTNGLSFLLSTIALLYFIKIQNIPHSAVGFVEELSRTVRRFFFLLGSSVSTTIASFCAAYYLLNDENRIALFIPFGIFVVSSIGYVLREVFR